jgi:tetratricopeptide (TPR) repeat protein
MHSRPKIILVNGVVLVALMLLLFSATTWWRMQTQYKAGERAQQRGDFAGAVAGYESAIRMYLPYSNTVENAAQQLWLIAESNERKGDIARALIAYRSLRSSFYAVRWLKTPGLEWIGRCDKKISALVPLLNER